MMTAAKPGTEGHTLQPSDDLELISLLQKARRGNLQAMERILVILSVVIRQMVAKARVHPNDVEDVLQEAVLTVIRVVRRRTYHDKDFPKYVLVCLYKCIRNPRPPLVMSFNHHNPQYEEHHHPLEIGELVRSLPDQQRQVVEAYFYRDQTITDIAARTHKDPATVKKALYESVQYFRSQTR
jgi:DNA-directed RNA polymerase specialized sigma24 family protein